MPSRFSLPRRPKLPLPLTVGVAVLLVLLLGFAGCQMLKGGGKADEYRTAEVTRGAITRSVSASGTLEALVTVDVGSQISGQIREVRADFNDHVTRGQVLAVLDAQTYVSRSEQGRAAVASAMAARNQAQAQAEVARAAYTRTKTLHDKGIMAPAALEAAEADWKAAQAAVASANAQIAQSRAALASNNVDLARTTIVSPITGVVVDREIEPGQTVAASLQAPVLFRIAKDLSRMQVNINVDEADIGQVRAGQAVRFTVDAFPDDDFTGVVTQVRLQPQAEQTVVAYTVIAEADNPDQKLLPGMTANADIIIDRKPNVVKVPAAALRWTPPDQEAGAGPGLGGPPPGMGFGPPRRPNRPSLGQSIASQLELDNAQKAKIEPILAAARQKAQAAPEEERRQALRTAMNEAMGKIEPLLKPEQKRRLAALRARFAGGEAGNGMTAGVVWVLRDGKPEPVAVRVGATDGSFTEIAGPLKPGDEVITGGGPKAKAGGASPFGPGGGRSTRIRM